MARNPPQSSATRTYEYPAELVAPRRWFGRRGAASNSGADPALSAPPHGEHALISAYNAPWLEELWDSHGVSIYTLAFALLGDEVSASQAVRLGLSDLASRPERASTKDALRSWARQVYLRSRDLSIEVSDTSTTVSTVSSLRQLAQPQRTCLALCLFGGHTSRDVASLLDVAPKAVIDLLRTGLREAEALGFGRTLGHA